MAKVVKNDIIPNIDPNTPLDETIIPLRVRKILNDKGIVTIGELAKNITFDLMFIRGFGNQSMRVLEDALELYGFVHYRRKKKVNSHLNGKSA
jgi:DNA-directed RNA polymerase alpha subunit